MEGKTEAGKFQIAVHDAARGDVSDLIELLYADHPLTAQDKGAEHNRQFADFFLRATCLLFGCRSHEACRLYKAETKQTETLKDKQIQCIRN
jgi:hypothetical protein